MSQKQSLRTPTPKEKECAKALGIDIDEWPAWLEKNYRRNSLRNIKAILAGHGVQVSHTFLSDQLREHGIATRWRKDPEEATA
jgi:hypothetical protein